METPTPTIVELKKMPARERREFFAMQDAFRMIERDLHHHLIETRVIPEGWSEIWQSVEESHPRRTRVTMRLDADVVKFFKGLGRGYQKRINMVLRAYMHGRLSKLVEGPDTTDWVLRPDRIPETPQKVDWGDSEIEAADPLADAFKAMEEYKQAELELAILKDDHERVRRVTQDLIDIRARELPASYIRVDKDGAEPSSDES